MRKLLTASVFLLAMLGIASAAGVTYSGQGVDTLRADMAMFSQGYVSRGPGMAWMLNTSASETLTAGTVVGHSPNPITVVTLAAHINGTDTATIADSLTTGALDTMFGLREPQGSPVKYDTAKLARFRIRVDADLNAGIVTSRTVTIYGYDNTGSPITLVWSDTISRDTILTDYELCKITLVTVRGRATTDSVAIYAEPTSGVKTSTGLAGSEDSTAYAGVAKMTILPRRRGPVQLTGPGLVKINATTTDIRAGYYVYPSATAGYATTSATRPNYTVIGRVQAYSQANGLANVMLLPPNIMVAGAAYDSAPVAANAHTLQTLDTTALKANALAGTHTGKVSTSDSVIGVVHKATSITMTTGGSTITNIGTDTLVLTETDVKVAGVLIPNSIAFANGTTIDDGHADTTTVTETNIKLAGVVIPNSITFANGTTIDDNHADTVTITETNVKVAGVLVPNSITLPNGTTIVNGHADTVTITEAVTKLSGKEVVGGDIVMQNGATIANGAHADTATITEVAVKVAGVLIPNSITFANGTTVDDNHADTVTITETNVKVAGVLVPNSITLPNGTTIVNGHADTVTVTEAVTKLSGKGILGGDVVLQNGATIANGGHADTVSITEVAVKVAGVLVPNSIALANGTTIDDGHADTTTITETNIKLAGIVIPNSVTFANGTTIDDNHADTTTITETNVKVAGVLVPNSITLPLGTTIANGHADTVTITEANLKVAGAIVATGHVTADTFVGALRPATFARTDKVTAWGDSVASVVGTQAGFTVTTKVIRVQDTLISGAAGANNCGNKYLFTIPAADSVEVLWCRVLAESIGTTGGTNTAVNAFSVGDSNATANPTLNGNEILWVASTNQNASLPLGYTTGVMQGTSLYTGGALTGGSIVNVATKVFLNIGGTPNADGRLGLKARVLFGFRSLKRGTW
jgi:hypothetical protein